jgi:hypothetical protein
MSGASRLHEHNPASARRFQIITSDIGWYLSWETLLNVEFKDVPRACTVAIIATAITAAMRP